LGGASDSADHVAVMTRAQVLKKDKPLSPLKVSEVDRVSSVDFRVEQRNDNTLANTSFVVCYYFVAICRPVPECPAY
jgi:hypothetical protein